MTTPMTAEALEAALRDEPGMSTFEQVLADLQAGRIDAEEAKRRVDELLDEPEGADQDGGPSVA